MYEKRLLKYFGNYQHKRGQKKKSGGIFCCGKELLISFYTMLPQCPQVNTKESMGSPPLRLHPSHSDGPGPANPWEMPGVPSSGQPDPDQR